MRRHKSGVSFHDPNNKVNETSSSTADSLATVDVTDHDPKVSDTVYFLYSVQP